MSNPALFDPTDSPPPPAYELTDQQYDQKTSQIIETSLAEPARQSSNDDFWEVWDEAAFEAAAARLSLTGPSSSSSNPPPPPPPISETAKAKAREAGMPGNDPEVAPLRIVKKSAQSPPPTRKEKERPSWYEEAQLDQVPQSSSAQPAVPQSTRASLPSPPRRTSYDREPTPPPSFEAVGPSLDGPPYEDAHPVQPGPTIIMTYSAGDSRPASPLQSPVAQAPSFGFPAAPNTRSYTPQPTHQHVPPAPRPVSTQPPPVPRVPVQPPVQQRASTEFSLLGPRVPFNPQVAYNKKPSRYGLPEEEPLPQKVDAASFYASSVSSYIPSRAPKATPNMPAPNHRASTYVSPIPQRASYMPTAQQLQSSSYNSYSNSSSYNPTTSYQATTHQNYPSYGQQPTPSQQTYPGYNQAGYQTGYQQGWSGQSGGQSGSQFGRPW